VVKATKSGVPLMECTWHLEAEDKETAEVAFKKLMPDYEVSKVKCKKEEEKPNEPGINQATGL